MTPETKNEASALLDQLLADQGGIATFEPAYLEYQASINMHPTQWDASLDWLLRNGYSRPAALRVVVQQVLSAQLRMAEAPFQHIA
jgi:hypothetical protein